MHMGPVFVSGRWPGRRSHPVTVDSPDCDLAPLVHPSLKGAAAGHLQRSCRSDHSQKAASRQKRSFYNRSYSELMSLGKIGFADPAIATRARLSVARGLARLNGAAVERTATLKQATAKRSSAVYRPRHRRFINLEVLRRA
jgi:hypothetical protein